MRKCVCWLLNTDRASRRQSGFTLIEMIMVIVILGIVATVAGQMLAASFYSYLAAEALSEADGQAHVAMARLQRELQHIRSTADLATMGASQISYTAMDGTAVTINQAGTQLQRNGQPLAEGIGALSFTYLQADAQAVATAAADVRYVAVAMTQTHKGVNRSLAALVYARNLR